MTPRICLAVLVSALLLSACGTDRQATEGAGLFGKVAASAKASLAARKGKAGAAQPADTEAMAASALKTVKGSILIAQFERGGYTTVLGQIGENAGIRTYATPDQKAVLVKSGVVVGTRGFGDDLMSAKADDAIRLIRSRSVGTAKRTYRYLDGEGIERPLPMTCSIAPAGGQTLAFGGQHFQTQQVAETCVSGPLSINNAYWVTGDGAIVMSHQWIGQAMGSADFQLIRP